MRHSLRQVALRIPGASRHSRIALGAATVFAVASGAQAVEMPDPFSNMAAKLLPAVVNISTSQVVKPEGQPSAPETPGATPNSPFEEFFKDFFDHHGQGGDPEQSPHGRKSISLGSGFIIDGAGYVVTNNHVISNEEGHPADEITVILQDNTNLKAELVGRDEKTDLALLKVKVDHPLPAVTFGDSDKERVGDWVMAVGNPFGLGGTVTAGILSAHSREIGSSNGPYDDFLQTDASINRGNSGGPLFNMDGEVIGINSAIFSPSGGSIGLGFAIPSVLARNIVGQLKQYGHARRGFLGARIQSVGPEVAEDLGLPIPAGALIAGVPADSPAKAGGIQPGDVLLNVDGKDVADARHLDRIVADASVEAEVPIKLWRDHAAKTLSIKLGEAKEDEQVAALPKGDQSTPGGSPVTELGLTLSPATPALKDKYQLGDNASVVVTGVAAGGPAADKDLKPGDVVVEVAQQEVKDLGDVTKKIDEARKSGRKTVLLLIDRSGDLRFVALRIDQG